MSNAETLLKKAIPYTPKNGHNGHKIETPTPEKPQFDPNKYGLDFFKDIPPPEPLVTYKGATICTPENITVISGPPKSGKSAFTERLLSSFIRREEHTKVDCFGLETARIEGHVIWIDTERSQYDAVNAARRIWKDAGYKLDEQNHKRLKTFHAKHLRSATPAERREFVKGIIEHYKPEIVIIDGISDLLTEGPNDEKESVGLVTELLAACDTHKTHIITVLHTAKTSGTIRGHIGSELARKCEAELTVTSDKGVHTIAFTQLRNAGVPPENPAFTFDETEKRFVACEPVANGGKKPNAAQIIANYKPYELKKFAECVDGCTWKDACQNLKIETGKAQSFAGDLFKRLKTEKYIESAEPDNKQAGAKTIWKIAERCSAIQDV